ncbi:MAG: DUF7544 domain-containing protein [Chthoniobacterales bacterium]
MDSNEPRIEIFAPFGEAFELTTKILFRPFDLKKWFVIGFAAFLATFFSGGGFTYQRHFSGADWNWKSHQHGGGFSVRDLPPWVIPVSIAIILLIIALVVLIGWLSARGRFIFTDCIVRNRAAIAEPWREFRTEGNRLFVFQMVVAFCSMLVFGGLIALYFLGHSWNRHFLPVPLIILFLVVYFLVALVFILIFRLMVPIMYRQRCTAVSGFTQAWGLLLARPGVFILFGLFLLLLFIAAAMVGCLALCVTCCLAALPYLGTVILLPVIMFLFAYPLCFIRQFGDAYDAFASPRFIQPPPLTIPPPQAEAPPIQEEPPPAL